MIIVGYQGIGKTTYCLKDKTAIDLESSSFSKSNPKWYEDYVRCAIALNENRIVFISSHKVVRNELIKLKVQWCIILPSIKLKNIWIERLTKRYNETLSDKDYRALKNTEEKFEENINDLMNENVKKYILNENDYVTTIIEGGIV